MHARVTVFRVDVRACFSHDVLQSLTLLHHLQTKEEWPPFFFQAIYTPKHARESAFNFML